MLTMCIEIGYKYFEVKDGARRPNCPFNKTNVVLRMPIMYIISTHTICT